MADTPVHDVIIEQLVRKNKKGAGVMTKAIITAAA